MFFRTNGNNKIAAGIEFFTDCQNKPIFIALGIGCFLFHQTLLPCF